MNLFEINTALRIEVKAHSEVRARTCSVKPDPIGKRPNFNYLKDCNPNKELLFR